MAYYALAIDDIKDFLDVIVKPFQVIFEFISFLYDTIKSFIDIFRSIVGLFNNILCILPSPLYYVLISYISFYILFIIFKTIKGII